MRLQKFNEHAMWQKDVREINDILNIMRDDPEIGTEWIKSDIARDMPAYKTCFFRTKEIIDENRHVSYENVLKDSKFDFCNRSQDVVDRLRNLGHTVTVDISYYTIHHLNTDGTFIPGKWNQDIIIENPIDVAYHTNIHIIWISITITDYKSPEAPKPKPVKKPWQFWK